MLVGCGPAWWGRAPVEPRDASPGPAGFVVEQLAAGSFHTCARLRGGQVRCWGMGASGQLGDGAATQSERPVVALGINDAVQIVAEGERTCAVLGDGSVWCWGRATPEELAEGAPAIRTRPQPVAGWRDVRQLALGPGHDCAVVGGGGVVCRGEGWRGAPAGVFADRVFASGSGAVPRLGSVVEVAVGYAFSCARTTAGEVLCWGWNEYGQCGDASGREHLTPVKVEGIAGAQALTAGFDHACALLSDGTAVCWGGDTFGQRGDGGTATAGPPARVVGLGEAQRVAAGQYRTTAMLADGTARGWGRELGEERTLWPECGEPREYVVEAETPSPRGAPPEPYCAAPAMLPLAEASEVVVGQLHACARTDEGQVLCWGSNAYGGVGDGGFDDRPRPTPVAW